MSLVPSSGYPLMGGRGIILSGKIIVFPREKGAPQRSNGQGWI